MLPLIERDILALKESSKSAPDLFLSDGGVGDFGEGEERDFFN